MLLSRPSSIQSFPPQAKRVFRGVIFDVYQWEQAGYDGKSNIFEKLTRADTAFVLSVTDEGKMLYASQEQPGKSPYLGLLGGRVEEGESAIITAQRELLEESGYEAGEWSLFDAYQPYSKIDWCIWVFIARGCHRVANQRLDGMEKIELQTATFDEFVDLILHHGLGDERLKNRFLEAKLDPKKMKELRQQLMGSASG